MHNLLIITWYALCFPAIYLLSSFKEEAFIDGAEIKNACIAHRALVVDDIRDFTVTVAVLMLLPGVYLLYTSRLKSPLMNALGLMLVGWMLWRFFIRLGIC